MTPMEDPRELLTPADIASKLQVTRKTVYRLLEQGEIPSVKIGRCVRVIPADVDEFLMKAAR